MRLFLYNWLPVFYFALPSSVTPYYLLKVGPLVFTLSRLTTPSFFLLSSSSSSCQYHPTLPPFINSLQHSSAWTIDHFVIFLSNLESVIWFSRNSLKVNIIVASSPTSSSTLIANKKANEPLRNHASKSLGTRRRSQKLQSTSWRYWFSSMERSSRTKTERRWSCKQTRIDFNSLLIFTIPFIFNFWTQKRVCTPSPEIINTRNASSSKEIVSSGHVATA